MSTAQAVTSRVTRPREADRARLFALPGGSLRLHVEQSAWRIEDLISIAARANTRRAFLFVSKVLGKHYPARPATMQAVHQLLARRVPACDGPVVFVGMAETATGLGHGVFEAWCREQRSSDAVFLQTTRYRVAGAEALTFEETHSHAPRVFLHLPVSPPVRARVNAATQVVLIDDELSTGNTFVNLVRVLRSVMPRLRKVHLASICDFMGDERRVSLSDRMGLPCAVGALATGEWSFEGNGASIVSAAAAQCSEGAEVCLAEAGYGRLGRDRALALPVALVERLSAEPVSGPTLVLGTGEFMHPSFVLARALDERGVEAFVQSTTRSPILVGGAVEHAMSVPDPYGEGVPNFLYNVRRGQYGRVLICHEVAPSPTLHELAHLVGGRLIHFQANDHAEEIPVC